VSAPKTITVLAHALAALDRPNRLVVDAARRAEMWQPSATTKEKTWSLTMS